MLDPIPTFAMDLVIRGLDAGLVNDLVSVLNGPLVWKTAESKNGARVMEANTPDWQLVLAVFSIADQEGHGPGDLGHSLAIRHKPSAQIFMRDDFIFHQVGAWLAGKLDPVGAGKTAAAGRISL